MLSNAGFAEDIREGLIFGGGPSENLSDVWGSHLDRLEHIKNVFIRNSLQKSFIHPLENGFF